VNECDAAGGRLIVMDAASGEILAMVDLLRPVPDAVPFPWPDAVPAVKGPHGRLLYEPPPAIPRARYITIKPDLGRMIMPAMARNRCVEDLYEPGSTFKPFVWATITELGLMKPDEVLDTGNGYWRTPYGRLVHDVHAKPSLSWFEVLVNSSNIGMGKGAEKMSHDQMYAAIRRFGFGSRTGLGLQGETSGMVTPRKQWSKYTQTSVSFGQEVAVTPVQMARAFSAFARTGELTGTLPQARLQALDEDDPTRSLVHRVLRPDVVVLTRKALRKVALEMEGKMLGNKQHPEGGWKYTIFGKSGTAQIPLGKAPKGKRKPAGPGYFAHQYNASFIAAGPAESPKLVCLVVIDDPGPELVKHAQYYGALTAGPVVRRVLERSLAYLGVPPSPPGETAKPIDASARIAD
jgi:cell division protein FtsI (penicillin-binding protein 3)